MTKRELRVADYLSHMQQAIERIQRYTQSMDEAAFLQNELVQDAVIRNLEIMGEAANKILKNDPSFAEQHKDVQWAVIYAMRNRVSHAYHQVDMELIWQTVQQSLEPLRKKIEGLLRPASSPSSPSPF